MLLIKSDPLRWEGYHIASSSHASLWQYDQDRAILLNGLIHIPNQVNLLILAADMWRSAKGYEISPSCAKAAIDSNPNALAGYEHAARDLIALKRFDDAANILARIPPSLKANDDYRDFCPWHDVARRFWTKSNRDDHSKRIIRFSEDFKQVIPSGNFCLSAQLLNDCSIRTCAMPFDWLFVDPLTNATVIENDFSDFLDRDSLEPHYPHRRCGDKRYGDQFFNHHVPTLEPDSSASHRRVERLREALGNPSDSGAMAL